MGPAAAAVDRRRPGRPATGGTSPCARSRSPAPSCSPPRGTPGRSSRRCAADNLDIGRPDKMQIIFGRRVRAAPRACYRTGCCAPDDEASSSTPSSGTPGSSPTSKRPGVADRDRRQRRRRPRRAAPPGASSANSPSRPVTSTAAWSMLSVSARAVSLRAQPLSGSRDPPSPRMVGGPRPCGSATLGSWPWPAPCAPDAARRLRVHQPEPARPVATLLGVPYTASQMSYDLRRLRLNGLITPAASTPTPTS